MLEDLVDLYSNSYEIFYNETQSHLYERTDPSDSYWSKEISG